MEYVLDLTQLTTISPPYQFFNSYHLVLWFTDGWRCALGDEKNPKAGYILLFLFLFYTACINFVSFVFLLMFREVDLTT